MASKWIKYKGQKLPTGVRLKRTAQGDRFYVRIMVGGSTQRDIPTDFFAGEPNALQNARAEYLRRKAEGDISPGAVWRSETAAAKPPKKAERASVRAVLTAEYAHFESRGTRRAKDLANFSRVAEKWERHLGDPTRSVADVLPEELRTYVHMRRREKNPHNFVPTYGSIFRELMMFRGAIRRAVINGHVSTTLHEKFPKLSDFPKDGIDWSKKALARSKAELKPFLKALPVHIRPFFELSLRTGMRACELSRIRVRDFEDRAVPVVHVHTKERRAGLWACRLSPGGAAIIRDEIERRGLTDPNALVFDMGVSAGKKGFSYSYTTTIGRLHKRLGLRGKARIKLRDCRATFGRAVYDRTGIDEARQALRHSTIEMTRFYLQLADDAQPVDVDALFE